MLTIKRALSLAMAAVAYCSVCNAQSLPVVQGPISGKPTMLGSTRFDLSTVGYEQSEYFISGTASSYSSATPLSSDGKWAVQVADQAAFETRILVYRPVDSTKFNGTVVIEWFNVSSGTEAPSEWIMTHNELIREGYAWVGVSAQKAGIDGGGINYLGLSLPLKKMNPRRYKSLMHPGDQYSYDIFSQAARAVIHPGSINPLSDLHVQRAIAVGESQSADFMLTYVNAVAPMDKLFDGYLIHSRMHGSAGLSPQTTGASIDFSSRSPVQVRNDLGIPVMMVQTETDLFGLGSYPDLQPDATYFRLWEIAGAAHADHYVSSLVGLFDSSDSTKSAAVKESRYAVPLLAKCDQPVNSGPQHFVVSAAMAALGNWVRNGVAPPHADRIGVDARTSTIMRDNFGNARGGIRTPYVDVPIATLSGEGQSGGPNGGLFCGLFGTTQLFDSDRLTGLYRDHSVFVSRFSASVDSAVRSGFLLQPDGEVIKTWAQQSRVR
jgi:hypothetical protein